MRELDAKAQMDIVGGASMKKIIRYYLKKLLKYLSGHPITLYLPGGMTITVE